MVRLSVTQLTRSITRSAFTRLLVVNSFSNVLVMENVRFIYFSEGKAEATQSVAC